jgi:hypothetical protein
MVRITELRASSLPPNFGSAGHVPQNICASESLRETVVSQGDRGKLRIHQSFTNTCPLALKLAVDTRI